MGIISRIKQFLSKKKKDLPPTDFFSNIKDKRQVVTPEMLVSARQNITKEVDKFIRTGQEAAANRLLYHIIIAEKEQEAIFAGFNKYVERDIIEEYIENVSQSVVKITELKNFERPIPDECMPLIEKARTIFTDLYILFTDYTGRETKKVAKKDRAKDPIVFGAFHSDDNLMWCHRFYFVADWEDEYCDLTLDRFVAEMVNRTDAPPIHEAAPINVQELEERLNQARKATEDIKNDRIVLTTDSGTRAYWAGRTPDN